MKCPNCSAEGPDAAVDCAACGVIFAKLKARAEKAAPAAPVAPAAPAAAKPAASDLGGTLVLLACLGAFVYGGYRFYESRVSPPPAEAKGVLVNPEPYKADILAIEAAVYQGSGSVQEVAAAAEAATNRIAEGLMRKHGRNPLARDAAADVMDFAARMVGAQESLGASPTARLEFVRAWETLRAKRFAPADWFHPAEAVKPGAPADFERAAQSILTTSQNLRAFLASASSEMEAFGEREVNLRRDDFERPRPAEDVEGQWAAEEKAAREKAAAAAAEDQPHLAAWRAWVPAWQARVDAALTDFPQPSEIPNELHDAYESLVRAAGAARQPPNPGPGAFVSGAQLNALYLPSKRSREEWVRSVTASLAELPQQVNSAREAKNAPKKP